MGWKSKYKGSEIDNLLTNVPIEKTTWNELRLLKTNGKLFPGRYYQITDYRTVIDSSIARSADHRFDIIVLALSVDKLSEEAYAVLNEATKEGEYFYDTSLFAWRLWYCLENDKNRFDWASTSGYGVIYRMVDEWGNDCPYDFKNIQFLHNGSYYYTFSISSPSTLKDATISGGKCYGNVVEPCFKKESSQTNPFRSLVSNLFIGTSVNVFSNNHLKVGCYDNVIYGDCKNNTFESESHNNTLAENCCYNFFGKLSSFNALSPYCSYNHFEDGVSLNTLGDSSSNNRFGTGCSENSLGEECHWNIFESNCIQNTLDEYCSKNRLFASSYVTLVSTSRSESTTNCIIEFCLNGCYILGTKSKFSHCSDSFKVVDSNSTTVPLSLCVFSYSKGTCTVSFSNPPVQSVLSCVVVYGTHSALDSGTVNKYKLYGISVI